MPKQPITVTITRTRRKAEDQPYTVTIAEPRKQPYTMKGRYARKDSAKRGALRHLKARSLRAFPGEWFVTAKSGAVTWIKFLFTSAKRK
jgi:hypothetical protein